MNDCLSAKLRPGNVSSAEDWKKLLVPEIDRQQAERQRIAFRVDAAFARPEIYKPLEARGVEYTIRIPANRSLELAIEDILFKNWQGGGASAVAVFLALASRLWLLWLRLIRVRFG